MSQLGKSDPKRIVVKTYGRDSILFGLVSPLIASLFAGRFGAAARSEAQVRAMENDANDMVRRGYRIVSSREYKLPGLGMLYREVRYELVDSTA
jgi:hypothetical protein